MSEREKVQAARVSGVQCLELEDGSPCDVYEEDARYHYSCLLQQVGWLTRSGAVYTDLRSLGSDEEPVFRIRRDRRD